MSGKRGKIVSESEFRRMWLDTKLPLAAIAERLDISISNVSKRAQRRGLPSRNAPLVSARQRKIECPEFPAMWAARVSTAHMACHYGVAVGTIWYTARRLGLPHRRITRWDAGITLADFRALQLREAMARDAAATRKAMLAREMIDGLNGRRAA